MNALFHIKNREFLTTHLEGGLAVFVSHTRMQRSNDAAYAFAQEPNFWYLTGIEDPDWTVIIDGSLGRSWLVKPDISNTHTIFDGDLSAEKAKVISGIDMVISREESFVLLRSLVKKHTVVSTIGRLPHSEHFNFSLNPSVMANWHMLDRMFESVNDIRKDLSKLRAIKRPEEINMIQEAVDITVGSFEHVKSNMETYKNECEIEADFTYHIKKAGADDNAYDPIVASGKNACTLHYVRNKDRLNARNLILMDLGASYGGYCADISRTYTKSEPNKRQRQVHQAVESAHQQIISLIQPMLAIDEYQRQVDDIMREAIASVGLSNSDDDLRRYMPHAVSHGLGIDVHDSLGAPKYFEESMVLTVEPGIYIPEESIGVRIEDDILVTATGHKNLSGKLSTGL